MSKIATDLEQSKRLLEAGLDPESADFFWVERKRIGNSAGDSSDPEPILNWIRPYDGGLMKGTRRCGSISYNYIPAWSLSRLLDIHSGYNAGIFYDSESLIESLVKSIVFLIDYGDIDSEYLVKHETETTKTTIL